MSFRFACFARSQRPCVIALIQQRCDRTLFAVDERRSAGDWDPGSSRNAEKTES